uniref:BLTX241 n=1 Tax=Nephila pilipes TaxID=299642 RepID=A0A076KUH4_NEPPI|nr:BLTX241 [Nephila pilipes]
MDICYCCKKDI